MSIKVRICIETRSVTTDHRRRVQKFFTQSARNVKWNVVKRNTSDNQSQISSGFVAITRRCQLVPPWRRWLVSDLASGEFWSRGSWKIFARSLELWSGPQQDCIVLNTFPRAYDRQCDRRNIARIFRREFVVNFENFLERSAAFAL